MSNIPPLDTLTRSTWVVFVDNFCRLAWPEKLVRDQNHIILSQNESFVTHTLIV
jgi:hypothetical protein